LGNLKHHQLKSALLDLGNRYHFHSVTSRHLVFHLGLHSGIKKSAIHVWRCGVFCGISIFLVFLSVLVFQADFEQELQNFG
jgi:hypothetical protein